MTECDKTEFLVLTPLDEFSYYQRKFSGIHQVEKRSNADLILGGNWNLVLNDQLDKDGGPHHTSKITSATKTIYIKFCDLNDIFRKPNATKKFTLKSKLHLIWQRD